MQTRLQQSRQAGGEATLCRGRRGQGLVRGRLRGTAHGPPLCQRPSKILPGRYRLLWPREVLRLHGPWSLHQGVLVLGLDLDQRKRVKRWFFSAKPKFRQQYLNKFYLLQLLQSFTLHGDFLLPTYSTSVNVRSYLQSKYSETSGRPAYLGYSPSCTLILKSP